MSCYPHSRLFVASSSTILISGPHIQHIHSTTGLLLSSKLATASSTVRCAAVDPHIRFLASASDDKILKVWQVDGLLLLSERELPKRPTQISFTRDSQTILVSDKFGDVFRYPLHPAPPSTQQEKNKDSNPALLSHPNPSGGKLVLGHTSLLTAFVLSLDEKYVISADRDEHIRVSWYPEGYVIERYCLGHDRFVSAVHIPAFDPATLISGGGDVALKVWDWMEGTEVGEVLIWDTVKAYVKVTVPKRRGRHGESDDDSDDQVGKPKRRGKGKTGNKSKTDINDRDDRSQSRAERETAAPDSRMSENAEPTEKGDPILAIHKIDTWDAGHAGRYIIFSAIGATALFTCLYPIRPGQDVKAGSSDQVQAFDFKVPVIDFCVCGDGRIWVSLDGEWNGGVEKAVRVVGLCDGELKECEDSVSTLLSALNTKCHIPANALELKALCLYEALESMPKNKEGDHNATDRDFDMEHAAEMTGSLSKKELGRLKSRKAVLDRSKQAEQDEEPHAKKTKGADGSGSQGDVVMMADS